MTRTLAALVVGLAVGIVVGLRWDAIRDWISYGTEVVTRAIVSLLCAAGVVGLLWLAVSHVGKH